MIDFRVAADKLAQFETPDEIAGYLVEHGIKAKPEDGQQCAIALFMQNLTGEDVFVGAMSIFFKAPVSEFYMELELAEDVYDNTQAMRGFIRQFDDGGYPELVVPGYQPPKLKNDYCMDDI